MSLFSSKCPCIWQEQEEFLINMINPRKYCYFRERSPFAHTYTHAGTHTHTCTHTRTHACTRALLKLMNPSIVITPVTP